MQLKVTGHRTPLFLFLSWVLKIIVFSRCEWQRPEHELCARRVLLVVDPWSSKFTWMNISASPLPDAHLSTVCCKICGVWLLLSGGSEPV
jgi:hypothetical protein